MESEIFAKKAEDLEKLSAKDRKDIAQKRTSFELAGGRQGIMDHEIDSWKKLLDQAERNVIQSIPSIDRNTLVKSEILDLAKKVGKLAREPYVKNLCDILSSADMLPQKFDEKQLESTLESMTDNQLSQALGMINDYQKQIQMLKMDSASEAPSLERTKSKLEEAVKSRASSIDDVIFHPELYREELKREQMAQMIESAIKHSTPLDALRSAKEADDLLGTNFTERMYDIHREKFDAPLDEILSNPINCTEWLDMLENSMEDFNQDAQWEDRYEATEKMQTGLDDGGLSAELMQVVNHEMSKQYSEMLKQSTTEEQLATTVETGRERNQSFASTDIRSKGQELGMSEESIARLIGGVFEHLKSMIQNEDPSYERVSALIENANLTSSQMQQLTSLAVSKKSTGALGAIANQDLSTVISNVPNTPEGEELLEAALGAGSGENLLAQWFKMGSRLPPWARNIVKKVAKQIMIDIAKAKAAALIGSSEAGPLPEGTTRPYVLGDEPDAIDLDETIENIIISGKQRNDIEVNDFIVRNTVSGRRCVVFLVDISGSMTGAPLAGASLATAMLLLAFARDELGVALFESSSHVICEVGQPIDIDEVVDEILDLTARGGTQMQAAVEWAEEQFLTSKSNDKMFVIASDACIGDFQRSETHLRNIADMGATSVMIVPKMTYGIGNIQGMCDAVNAALVVVDDWEKFPEIVSKVLSRS